MGDPLRIFAPDKDGSGLTVRFVVESYIAEKCIERDLGAFTTKSVDRLNHYLGAFADDYGKLHVHECQRGDLIRWLKAHPEWDSTFTRQDAISCVVSAFKWGEDALDFRSRYRRPKFLGPPVKPRPAIKPDQYKAMRLHSRRAKTKRGRRCRTREVFRIGLCFLWKTGARTCEMRDAEWDGLDWERAILTTKSKTGLVTGNERMIPVRRLLPLLRWLHKRRRRGQKRIFVNSQGRPWTCDRFAKEFRRFANLAGVPKKVSAYCLRHGMTVRLLEKNVGQRQIADVLGLKSTRYVEWYGRETRRMGDYLNDVVGNDS